MTKNFDAILLLYNLEDRLLGKDCNRNGILYLCIYKIYQLPISADLLKLFLEGLFRSDDGTRAARYAVLYEISIHLLAFLRLCDLHLPCCYREFVDLRYFRKLQPRRNIAPLRVACLLHVMSRGRLLSTLAFTI
jgi:hypothetical protein